MPFRLRRRASEKKMKVRLDGRPNNAVRQMNARAYKKGRVVLSDRYKRVALCDRRSLTIRRFNAKGERGKCPR